MMGRRKRVRTVLFSLSIVVLTVFGTHIAEAVFTRVGSLTFNSGENGLSSAVLDRAAGFAYFGTDTSPGVVVKVRLSDFTRVGALTLQPGENDLTSAVID